MANSKAKGNQHELEVKKYLEALGWIVFRQHRRPMWIQGRMVTVGADIFGCDLVAKKQGEKTRWIQVGAEGAKSKKEDQLNEFPWDPEKESTEIWLRVQNKKAYKVYVLGPVALSDGGRAQSFVDAGLHYIGHPSASA